MIKFISRKISVFFIVLWVSWASLAFCKTSYAENSPKGSPIQIHGELVEYFQNENKAVGTGNVVIDYEGDKLEADKITVYTDKKLALAEGHVVLTQEDAVYKGERGEYDFSRKIGNVSKLSATIGPIPYYGKAREVSKEADGHYKLHDSTITTCCGDNPFYKFQAQQLDLYPDDRVEVRNALLVIKNVPILFIPFYVQKFHEIQRFPVQFVVGDEGEWGPFVLSRWRYQLIDKPWLKSRGKLHLDYRSKRGWGYGTDNYYTSDWGRGLIKYYQVRDNAVVSSENPDRYRVQVRHQAKLEKYTTLVMEGNKLSDPDMVKDFFYREEYEKDIQPDNYVSIIMARPEYSLSFLERKRFDDFYTVVERSPEVRFDTYNKQFQDTPFYLRNEFQFSSLQKRFANSETEYDSARVDTNQTLLYAGHVGDFSVAPRVGMRQTYYRRSANNEGDEWRGTFDPGLDISTRFYKVYDVSVHAMGLDYNQLRHIFTPTISYNFRPNPTAHASRLLQFDQIDSLDKQHFIRFNFENKIQTREHVKGSTGELKTREIARVIPFFDMDYNSERLENIGYDIELRPYEWLSFAGDGTYSSRLRAFETLNSDIYWTLSPFTLSLGHRYLRRDSSQLTTSASWDINKDWTLSIYQRHEFKSANDVPGLTELTVTRRFDCVAVDVVWSKGRDSAIFVVVHIKGFEDQPVHISKTYSRAKLTEGNPYLSYDSRRR